MTVVHIFWSLGFGGIETMLVNIANAQTELGADVHIIIVNELAEKSLVNALDKRVHFHCLNRKLRSHNLWFIVKMNRLLLRIKPDAIHLHGSQFYSILLSRRLSRVASSTLHDLPTGALRREGLLPRLLPILNFHIPGNVCCIDRIPRVFAISKAVQEALLKNYGVKSMVVENGILTDKFQHRDEAIVKAGQPLRIVCVSRLEHEKKGQDLLIEAAAKLEGMVDVTFIGEGRSSDFLKDMAHKLNADNYVHFPGKKPQSWIAEHLKDYDLFVQPSRWEGFGLTVAEAMAAKLPVLVSSGQGPAEVTENDKYGWIFKNGDANDLADKIRYVGTHYEDALKKTDSALKHVRDCYDVSVTAKTYLDNYLRI